MPTLNSQMHTGVIKSPTVTNICPGLNELTDALAEFPNDIVSYFTLLREIDAKCVHTIPYLKAYVKRFLEMKKDHPKRPKILIAIKDCIKELMPCLEEKMHVATIASDNCLKHSRRIEQSFDMAVSREIPELVRIGPMWEPCMKVSEPKTVQQQRSETRREAIAARRVRNGFEDDYDSNLEDSPVPSTNNNSNSNSNGSGLPANKTNGHSNSHIRKPKASASAAAAANVSSTTSTNKSSTVKRKKHAQSDEEFKSNSKRTRTTSGNTNGASLSKAKKEAVKETSNGNTHTRSTSRTKALTTAAEVEEYEGEPLYCYCQQVSYGEMVGCDGENCEREWFHLPCIGLKELPKGEWYCDDCKSRK